MLDASDIVFKDVLSVIHRAKELANRGASTHLDETSKKALADEVFQLHDSLLQLANSTHGGRYLFAGQHTQTVPFELVEESEEGRIPDVVYLQDVDSDHADVRSLEFEIGVGVTMGVNVDAEALFDDIFSALQILHAELSGLDSGEERSPWGGF